MNGLKLMGSVLCANIKLSEWNHKNSFVRPYIKISYKWAFKLSRNQWDPCNWFHIRGIKVRSFSTLGPDTIINWVRSSLKCIWLNSTNRQIRHLPLHWGTRLLFVWHADVLLWDKVWVCSEAFLLGMSIGNNAVFCVEYFDTRNVMEWCTCHGWLTQLSEPEFQMNKPYNFCLCCK